ncbi:MAG: GNAT family N-acetyltransferase [Sphingobacteriaceae bacterium]|nr:GNAT family N-acetyltransferase [Sphingobacteriaceae bacterium]
MMRIVEVNNKSLAQTFVQIPDLLFGDWPQYVAVPTHIVQQLFDPAYNQKAASLRIKRWVLFNNKQPIGRIAAFDHPKKAANDNAGALGFFACIQDPDAAALLLSTAENWLKTQGYDWVDGPLNVGENDQYWGVLVEGFERPSFGMNWNPAYYESFFRSAAYEPYYEQLTNYFDLQKGLPERFHKIADWAAAKSNIQAKQLDLKRFHFFAEAVVEVFNSAWVDFENFQPIDVAKVQNDFRRMKPILLEDLVWFAFVNEAPAAFLIMLPDLNEVLERTGPVDSLWGKLKFLYYRRITKFRKLKIVAMGVHQRFQNMGVESVLLQKAYKQLGQAHPSFQEVELAWVGDFNKKMLALHAAAGAVPLRKHITFRKSFQKDQQVKKFEIKTA